MTRSELMSRIRSKGNKSTELAMVKLFHKYRLTGWRRQQRVCGINVDFVFPKRKRVVFVDGCFWHACGWCTNINNLTPYWVNKVLTNRLRDIKQNAALEAAGWTVQRTWEHDLKGIK